MTEPSFSPDGKEIAFVSGGDIWAVPADGGSAHLLVSHQATESRPLYSPDGSRLAFISNRTGAGDIYVLDFRTGSLTRITYDDAGDVLDAWSRDGKWLYFSSTSRDIGLSDIYRVAASGGTPMQMSADRYTSEYFAAPSPDGSSAASAHYRQFGTKHGAKSPSRRHSCHPAHRRDANWPRFPVGRRGQIITRRYWPASKSLI